MSSSNCCFLTCIQVSQEAGQVVWYSHLFQNFLQFIAIHTVKGFGIVNKAEIDVFLELSCFFHDPVDVGSLISGSPAFSKTHLNIWKFMVHVLLKPGLENFKHHFTSVWDECNCAVVWAFFGIAFFGIGMKTDLFLSYGHCWVFQICWHTECSASQHHLSGFEIAQLNSITSTSFVRSDPAINLATLSYLVFYLLISDCFSLSFTLCQNYISKTKMRIFYRTDRNYLTAPCCLE